MLNFIFLLILSHLLLKYSFTYEDGNLTIFGDITKNKEVVVLSGSKVEFNCTLNQSEAETKGWNSSQVFWYKDSNKLNSTYTQIIDDWTLTLILNNVIEDQSGIYYCKVQHNNMSWVCYKRLMVGNLPPTPLNLEVVSKNWQDMNITWIVESYSQFIHTNYTLHFKFGKHSSIGRCPDGECSLDLNIVRTACTCYFSYFTNPSFMKLKSYDVQIIGSNQFGSKKFRYKIEPAKHVIPNPPNVFIDESGTNSCSLSWSPPYGLESYNPEDCYLCPGITYKLTYRLIGNSTENLVNLDDARNYKLNNLHPFSTYDIKLQAKPKNQDDRYWGPPARITCRTKSSVPGAGAVITKGGFMLKNSKNGGSERNITLYWQVIPEELRHGQNITYSVEAIPQFPVKSARISTQETSVTLTIFKNSSYYIFIYTSNEVGISQHVTKIFLEKTNEVPSPPEYIQIVYFPKKYVISWSPPHSPLKKIMNYTIFWCFHFIGSASEGEIRWITVNPEVYSAIISDLEDGHKYKFAVSADNSISSSGILWHTCIANNESVPNKMQDIYVESDSSSSMTVRWATREHCSNSIIKYYRVNYCQLNDTGYCFYGFSKSKTFETNGNQGVIIYDLIPFTRYDVNVAAGSNAGWGINSDIRTIITKEAVPSDSPDLIEIENITVSSFVMLCKSPAIPNGLIRRYVVYLNNKKISIYVNKKDIQPEKIMVANNMPGYTNFSIKVQACTNVGCSPWSISKTFSTPIGYPSKVASWNYSTEIEDKILISWKRPLQPNGLINYYIVKFKDGTEQNLTDNFIILQKKCSIQKDRKNEYISIAAVNVNSGHKYVGEWVHVEIHICSPPLNQIPVHFKFTTVWGLIIGGILLVIVFGLLCFLSQRVCRTRTNNLVVILPDKIANPSDESKYEIHSNVKRFEPLNPAVIPITSQKLLDCMNSDEELMKLAKHDDQHYEYKTWLENHHLDGKFYHQDCDMNYDSTYHNSMSSTKTLNTQLSIDSGVDGDCGESDAEVVHTNHFRSSIDERSLIQNNNEEHDILYSMISKQNIKPKDIIISNQPKSKDISISKELIESSGETSRIIINSLYDINLLAENIDNDNNSRYSLLTMYNKLCYIIVESPEEE